MMSSVEIAQMAQQSSMMNASFGRPDQLAGNALNSAAAMGGPGLMGVMGMMGLDPMSIGMSAGWSALSGSGLIGSMTGGAGLGLAGSAGVGLGAAAAVGLPMMGAGYIGHQMMQGAQQQQYLNSSLARSFNFNGNGRRGFSRSDTSAIGMAMREMTHDVGPNGELTSMKELSDMAGKMGQMGMMKGVRDAQEFNSKFREMVKTMKTIATEMGTSMSQAMEMMQASKSAGMFTTGDQMRFTRNVSNLAAASGLATSEVSAMGNIGSQISRAYGGLGKQGAIGGMRAIGQVGGALQSGVLSEEDIYNATGMSGAEGRQAFASNMMSQTGSFLRSGKGRWFMASMAGANGTIDEAAASKYMLGGVGVGDTRGMAGKHLNEVGRANFIRNEGRLRGAVMERFGAVAPAVALMGWASEKGIDINNMDDRAMLFAQRHLGMGRDETDDVVKMAQNLPRIMRSQLEEASSAQVTQKYGVMQRNGGVEGIKRRFEHAKEKINSGFQQAGADMYQELTDYIGGLIDNWAGTAVPEATSGLSQMWHQALRTGDRRGMQAMIGGGKNAFAKSGDTLGAKRMSWQQFEGSGTLAGILTGKGELEERMKKVGYGEDIERIGNMHQGTLRMGSEIRIRSSEQRAADRDKQQAALNNLLDNASALQQAVTGNVRDVTVKGALRSSLLEEYAGGAVGKAGLGGRSAAVEKALEASAAKGDPQAKEMLTRLKSIKSDADKAAFVAGIEQNLGITGSSSMRSMGEFLGSMDSATTAKLKGKTGLARDEEYGKMMLGTNTAGNAAKGAAKETIGGFLGNMLFPVLGAVAGQAAARVFGGGSEDKANAVLVGKAARSMENRKLALGVMQGDSASRDQALTIIGNANSERATGDEKANAVVARNILAASEIEEATRKEGASLSDASKERILKNYQSRGGSFESYDEIVKSAGVTAYAMGDQNGIDRKRIMDEVKQDARDKGGRLESMGVLAYDEKTSSYSLTAKSKKAMGDSRLSMQAASMELDMLNKEASGDIQGYFDTRQKHQGMLGKMSAKELKAHVEATGDQDAAVLYSDAKRYQSGRKRGGDANAFAQTMGLGGGETNQQKRALITAMGQGTDAYMDEYFKQINIGGEDAARLRGNKDFRAAVEAAKSGKGNGVEISALINKVKDTDPKLAETMQKKAEARMGPQEKMAAALESIKGSMAKLTPAAIGSEFATTLGTALQKAGIVPGGQSKAPE